MMRVRRLAVGHADDTAGVKFAGRSYETTSGKPDGRDTFTDVVYGKEVEISDTEAILIDFLY